MLDRVVSNDILSLFPALNVDLFATRLNKQLKVYCSLKPDPGCAFVDSFSIDSRKFNFYAFPTFDIIPRYIQKIT